MDTTVSKIDNTLSAEIYCHLATLTMNFLSTKIFENLFGLQNLRNRELLSFCSVVCSVVVEI